MIAAVASIARITLGVVFLMSAWPKLRRPSKFAIGIASYGVPAPMATGIALACTELVIGVGLIFLREPAVLPAAIALLFLFASIAIRNLASTKPLPCYCFGSDTTARPRWSALRLMMLLALAGLADLATYQGAELPAALAAIGVVLIGAWTASVRELAALMRTQRVPAPPSGRRSFADLPLASIARSSREGRT